MPGDVVRIELLTRRSFEGTVVWSVPPYSGIKFNKPLGEDDPIFPKVATKSFTHARLRLGGNTWSPSHPGLRVGGVTELQRHFLNSIAIFSARLVNAFHAPGRTSVEFRSI